MDLIPARSRRHRRWHHFAGTEITDQSARPSRLCEVIAEDEAAIRGLGGPTACGSTVAWG